MHIITIKKNDAGQRLDKFLGKAVCGLPASLMYKYIRTKKIKVNRKRADEKYMLQEGDEIQLFIRDEFFASPEKDTGALSRIKPKIDIVYEDENIILCNNLNISSRIDCYLLIIGRQGYMICIILIVIYFK